MGAVLHLVKLFEIGIGIVILAVGSVGLTFFLRSVVPGRWVEEVKPWSCDGCMSWWGALVCDIVAVSLGYGSWKDGVVVLLPAFALALFLVKRWVPVPAEAPPLG